MQQIPMLVDVIFNLPVAQSFTYIAAEATNCRIGARVIVPFGTRTRSGFVIALRREPPREVGELRTIVRVIDEQPLFDSAAIALARWVSQMYCCSLGEALATMLPSGRREVATTKIAPETPLIADAVLCLTDQQRQAIATILQSATRRHYLYGVPGSGKSEVCLQLAQQVIDRGQGVIYLIPEIALGQQLTETIRTRFDRRVAVMHSRLTPSQRLREWRRIQRGEARLVIGARSAVFVPIPRLGLIVVDEEHETAYKSSSTPRYHARQVALKRCADEGAHLVLASATPSIEAWYGMQERRFQRIDLTVRPAGGAAPQIRIVDMHGIGRLLAPALEEAIQRVKRAGRQTILFLNRRGYAQFFHCRACGYVMQCIRCSVSLTYHKQRKPHAVPLLRLPLRPTG